MCVCVSHSWVQLLEGEGIISKFVPIDFNDPESVFDQCLAVSVCVCVCVYQSPCASPCVRVHVWVFLCVSMPLSRADSLFRTQRTAVTRSHVCICVGGCMRVCVCVSQAIRKAAHTDGEIDGVLTACARARVCVCVRVTGHT